MDEIQLFVCCHQPIAAPEHPLLTPVQAGAALTDERFPGFRYDNTGEHISGKNRSYCELTVQYWAWKNVDAEFYGFFHYRRYLYPDASAKRPYRLALRPSPALLERLGYDRFPAMIRAHDLILPKGEDMRVSVREQYASAPFQSADDLRLAEEIVRTRFPDYADAMETYLSGTAACFGNLFIMRRALFRRYCEWLFAILEEFDRSAPRRERSAQERRVDGYLAERLFGVFAAQLRKDPSARCLELPRVHFAGNAGDFLKNQALYLAFPPGTGRRALAKRLWKGRPAWKRRPARREVSE